MPQRIGQQGTGLHGTGPQGAGRPEIGRGDVLDALVVGGGPAGLTAALYLARFRRRFALVDAGEPRAAWIPESHNIPFFPQGIPGPRILEREREHLARYGAAPLRATVAALRREAGHFVATLAAAPDDPAAPPGTAPIHPQEIAARRVLLATGAVDVEPDLPDLSDAIRRGLVRYCPICDGYEARDRAIAVIGHGDRGLGEAGFIARTYSDDVTLLTLGSRLTLRPEQLRQAGEHGIKIVEQPIAALDIQGDRIAAMRTGDGAVLRFDVLYSALGLTCRSELAAALGAEHDATGALCTDEHNQTSIPGLYAAGDVARGLDQIVVAMGHAAVAATHIHNRCELPTEEEPGLQGHSQGG